MNGRKIVDLFVDLFMDYFNLQFQYDIMLIILKFI